MVMVLRMVALTFLLSIAFAAGASVPAYIQQKAVPILKGQVPAKLFDALYNKRLLLIGESHGTNEAPEFTLDVIKTLAKSQPVTLGLEFPRDLEGKVREFIATGDGRLLADIPYFKDPNIHSGRASQAMLRLLRELKNIPGVKVFCFDLPTTSPNDVPRDAEMARTILAEMKAAQKPMYVILTGNIHSRLAPGYPGNSVYPTMGSQLLSLSRGKIGLYNATNIMVRSFEGTAWQCWRQKGTDVPDCGLKILKPFTTLYSSAVRHQNYFLFESEMVDGHRMTVFFRKVSASPPAF